MHPDHVNPKQLGLQGSRETTEKVGLVSPSNSCFQYDPKHAKSSPAWNEHLLLTSDKTTSPILWHQQQQTGRQTQFDCDSSLMIKLLQEQRLADAANATKNERVEWHKWNKVGRQPQAPEQLSRQKDCAAKWGAHYKKKPAQHEQQVPLIKIWADLCPMANSGWKYGLFHCLNWALAQSGRKDIFAWW